jgi:cell division inhibitor SepF
MSNFMKNARTWLGLGNDPYYDDEYGDPDDDDHVAPADEFGDDDEPVAPIAATPSPAPRARPTAASRSTGAVRAASGDWDEPDGGVRVISAPASVTAEPENNRGVVRPLPSASKPHVVAPTNFNDVQEVADTFKRSQPVIVNLQGVDRDLSRRLIDFGSGLCYGLEGNMERITDQVFLLTPHGAQVSDDDRRRIREGSLVDEDR